MKNIEAIRTNNPPYVCIISLLVNIMFFQCISAQTEGKKDQAKYYRTWITFKDNPLEKVGYMTEVLDKQITLIDISSQEESQYHLGDINYLKFKREKVVGRNALIGALGGAVIVGIIASANDDFFTDATAFGLGALIGLPLGALLGVVGSELRVKVPIRGRKRDLNERLLRYRTTL